MPFCSWLFMLINMLFVKIYFFFNGRYWFLFLCLREAYDSFFLEECLERKLKWMCKQSTTCVSFVKLVCHEMKLRLETLSIGWAFILIRFFHVCFCLKVLLLFARFTIWIMKNTNWKDIFVYCRIFKQKFILFAMDTSN